MSQGRLRALRMVGFKSFAERTTVEFGPGISCVIGPNGSGKSNLADALRWALGEQGRSLRTRRAEDLIFAGSSSRRAIGMADVTLVIDNHDRLLPVDFAEIELGRRLFRSGENEYLLNRQRIRLRDLVDLLDEANLADNAFLFIGQGMVDQALALRPEERRPLFEEAAGIRKHERRRRAAESELADAETNVERVRDILAELRPQARRLAAQAEQQEQRRSAGTELAEGLVAFGRARLIDAERQAARHRGLAAAERAEADAALAELREVEEAARSLALALSERADAERDIRARLDEARARTLEQRLAETRCSTETGALARERARLEAERHQLESRVAEARRAAAIPLPEPDPTAEEALRHGERALEEAIRHVESVRAGTAVAHESRARWLATRRSQQEELARVEGRHRELLQRVALEDATSVAGEQRLASLRAAAAAATASAHVAAAEERRAEAAAEAARGAISVADLTFAEQSGQLAVASAELTGLTGRTRALEALVAAAADQEAYKEARRLGGQPLAEGLDVEPELRTAVEAALGDALRGVVVDERAALALRRRQVTLLVPESAGRGRAASERTAADIAASVAGTGGGPLAIALRRDAGGQVARLLARTLWVDDLETALSLRSGLPAGWQLVTRAGELVRDDGVVRVGQPLSQLEQQAQLHSLEADRARATQTVRTLESRRAEAESLRSATARALDEARLALEASRRARRIAEEHERSTGRTMEAAAREHAWQTAVLERSREQLRHAAAELARVRAGSSSQDPEAGVAAPTRAGAGGGVSALQARADALRVERDARAARVQEHDRLRAEAEERRRRAEIGATMDERRLTELDSEMGRLTGAEADLGVLRERVAGALAGAAALEQDLVRQLNGMLDAGGHERGRLVLAEAGAAAARARLRAAEGRGRSAEVREMEARLRVDSARETLLVELAAIGPDALLGLRPQAGPSVSTGPSDGGPDTATPEALGPALEAALDHALSIWRLEAAPDPPGPGRLASLRRRYHELGASNPFAATEYAEVRDRVQTLDAQREDLETAIRGTRDLIGSLNTLIAEQFLRTFTQLEVAFARRFTQLFDGGEAQLSLTVPDDLSTTGVEILARPPGKKRQPLAMLSGGERTLTAVALLLAMLEVRPVPFCVLDEVDAALDEANVGRFSAALQDLATTIQFVVITHNRGTIEAADALYGVTVGDDAVSRVVSMRLDGWPLRPKGSDHTHQEAETRLVALGPGS